VDKNTLGRLEMYVAWQKGQIGDRYWPITTKEEAWRYLEEVREVENYMKDILREEVLKLRRETVNG
jgi:hypothetical protein